MGGKNLVDDETMTNEEKAELFRQTMASEEARKAYAQSWATLILEQLPAESTVRSIYTVEDLPVGGASTYQKDFPYVDAWIMPALGSFPQNLLHSEEVTIVTWELVGNVEYRITLARDGRFDVAGRARQRLMDSFVDGEEDNGWPVIKAAITSDNTVTASDYNTGTDTGLTKAVLNAVWVKMEDRRDYKVTGIFVPAARKGEIRMWEATTIDPVTQREIFVGAGLEGLWNAELRLTHRIDDDEGYAFDGRPGLLGYMPIREALSTFDDVTAPLRRRYGICGVEELGFGILNPDREIKIDFDDV